MKALCGRIIKEIRSIKLIKIKENNNDVQEFNYLYDAVGWGHYDEAISEIALKNTFYSISVYDDDKIIGYGRLIGDQICFIYVQDIMVVPEYQGKTIGTYILKILSNKIDEIKQVNPNVRVYLGSSKGKEEFYKKNGYITRKEAGLGEGMILK